MVHKAFKLTMKLKDNNILTISQGVVGDKPCVKFANGETYILSYEEWNELVALGPLLVTPHVTPNTLHLPPQVAQAEPKAKE